jgi:hypothetical protein
VARSRTAQPAPVVVESDFSKGIIRDSPRVSIPNGGVYDSTDFLLHQPGLAQKRGGTSYPGPALTAATYAAAVKYAEFPAGPKLVAVGDNGHLYTVTSGATTDVSALGATYVPLDVPKLRVGGGKNLLIITANDGTTAPKAYTGAAVAALGGTPPAGKYAEVYKTRLVLANTSANPNRLFFSQTPDIESTWDTTNSYIDADYEITGLASLHNALLIFSKAHTERIIGATPPPDSDMDRAPVGSVGCTDARSIVVQEDNCLFANPRGVYLTNGAGFASLTTEGLIESYWQGLFASYDPASWSIAAGVFRSFYVVSIMNGSTLIDTLMCNVPRRAWWRLTNVKPLMFSQAVAASEELYYADRSTNRLVALSGIFSPASGNKNDANGTAVTPTLEWRAIGDGTGIKNFGFGRVTYTMTDAASDNPTLALTVKTGVDADTSTTPAESPLAETTVKARKRFTVFKDAQAVTVKVTQANASAKTEINALEVEQLTFPLSAEGIS